MMENDVSIKDSVLVNNFRERAKRFSTRVAVSDKNGSLTYSDLDSQSDAIATVLTAAGFARGNVAVILMDRSSWAISCMIGVLKAGGAYLFLEPTGVFLRNKEIILESSAKVILTNTDILDEATRSSYQSVAPMVDVKNMQVWGSFSESTRVVGEDAAYIIYTSGSTGKPKGAINNSRSVVNLAAALHKLIVEPFESAGALNIAVVAPFVFDPCVQQIFVTLLYGHCLHIVPEMARFDGRELIRFFNDNDICISDGTPTHLKLLQHTTPRAGRRLTVQHFIIGGEPLTVQVVKGFLERFDDAPPTISNVYGVAECCVDSTCYHVNVNEIQELGFVPVGRALPCARIILLDEFLKEVPAGKEGQLFIGGPNIGDGYLGLPTLTRERFIADPANPQLKLYRTGDLARTLPDGNIQLLGRVDRQIKIRGNRIEPEEIESVIKKYTDTFSNLEFDLPDESVTCSRCLLTTNHPGITIKNGVCSTCQKFETHRPHVDTYFQTIADFQQLIETSRVQRKNSDVDALLLYSGGKDSTYVLMRLIEMGYKIETFTFDNGYISKTAFENIDRITKQYGIKHITCSIDNMNKIFHESLSKSSTVCNGCFRSLTMLSTKLAYDRGINVVITGLSRGQIYDTKLKRLFDAGVFGTEDIESRLLTHRKIFYAQRDIVSEQLEMPPEETNDNIHYVDFFRYSGVSSSEVREYLAQRDKFWIAPKDTGLCSTNCLMNDVGIHVHKLEKGYHNYIEPLSWDCRLGVTTKENAQHELDAKINTTRVKNILDHLKYAPNPFGAMPIEDVAVVASKDHLNESFLTVYFTAKGNINIKRIRDFISSRLPDYMMPSKFVRIKHIPITHNGKIDFEKLVNSSNLEKEHMLSGTKDLSVELTDLWMEVLNLPSIDMDDNFFDIGGHSLSATILIGRIEERLGKEISVIEAVTNPTIRKMTEILSIR